MNSDGLLIYPQTREAIEKMYCDQIRSFQAPNNGERLTHGFFCITREGYELTLQGVESRRIETGPLRASEPVKATVKFGHLMFDHNRGAGRSGPDWRQFPSGLRLATETGPYQAAVVYGNAQIRPNQFAARLYWGKPGQTADDFREELLKLLSSN